LDLPINYRIAVQTDDMRYYHKLSKLFETSPLRAKFFAPNQPIPYEKFDLVISPHESINQISDFPIFQLSFEQIHPSIIIKIIGIIARRKEPKFKLLIVGVDPGKQIGLAAICDGMTLVAETSRLNQLARKIEEYLVLFPSEKVVIRVGDQPSSVSKVVFNKLFTIFGDVDNIKLEIVEEAYSSSRKTTTSTPFSPDETAAITIAHRQGKTKNHLVRTLIPFGRIKEIQKWSRNLSNNQITLDTELAQSVALGDISLEEAIKQKERQLEAKKND
jgi:predicted RNase H-like nuclease (RuvC/YqgF family)